jgi:uncharacterized membrane protein
METASPASFTSRFRWSGYLLGFALGGFFDGILLHQILQWHHLLSGLEGEAFRDLRVQILADGVFHALMYVVAAIGLALLWRARQEFAAAGADRLLFANVLIGFGVWHIVDGILSHWILGIHRIRMDTASPHFWDLLWFVVFGIIPLLIGWLIRRNPPMRGLGGRVAGCLLALAIAAAGAVSALPPRDVSQVIVYFGPGANPQTVFAAAAAVDARVVWSDRSGELWMFDLPEERRVSSLYRHGAWLVGNSLLPVGCLSWSRAI